MNALKSQIITMRASSDEVKEIKTKAAQYNQSVSHYILEKVLYSEGLMLSHKQQIYAHLCKIKDFARHTQDNNMQILEECNSIWQLLNS